MSLTANYTFVGKGNWSIDGSGGQASGANRDITARVPDGSFVEAANLYASTYTGTANAVTSVDITNAAGNLTVTGFSALGVAAGFLQAYRADVTSYVRSVVGDGDGSDFNFNLSNIVGSSVDGFALVVVYSNPDESTRTISLLDGFSATAGDSFQLNFSQPVDTDQAGFEAQMSLGIGFSYYPASQFSTVTVGGRQLTTSAGAQDDGSTDFSSISNGGLLTIGGIGDSTDNPDPDLPINAVRTDDELYDLAKGNVDNPAAYLADDSESINVTTVNPSNDDNIFFAGFNITAVVAVDTAENDAPVAVGDSVSVDEGGTVSFNVMANDFDPDEGDDLALVGVDTTGLLGMLVNNGDGTFDYDPSGAFDALNDGDTATTSFKYTISDGEETSTATVTITINGSDDAGPTDPTLPNCPVVTRAGTIDLTPTENQTVTGGVGPNSFYVSKAPSSGKDVITNFGPNDVLVTDALIRDGNGDGIIAFGSNKRLDLDNAGQDNIKFDASVSALRFLGESCEGVYVYADALVRPKGAIEGRLGDDLISGDVGDAKSDVFFFDNALGINLGDDKIVEFGAKDILVTTSALRDSNGDGIVSFGADEVLDLPDAIGELNINGKSVKALEFDGSVSQGDVTYYVYSHVGSAADESLLFAV
ncbi:Calx-beta domain protein [Sphingomonas paucimobilis]|nr:Calx-beta domain protein [Sphingomonas paucimobilis]